MIFISGNVPSSKNSKQWTGKKLINSSTVRKYIEKTEWEWVIKRKDFLKMLVGKEKPYRISFYFIRGTHHKFDYINPAQTVQDLMVQYGWIEDDNCDEIIPCFAGYKVDKKAPGVYIKVL